MLVKDFIEQIKVEEGLTFNTAKNYHSVLSSISSYLSKEDITIEDLASLKGNVYAAHMRAKGLKNSTITKHIKIINSILAKSDSGVKLKLNRKQYAPHYSHKSLSKSDIIKIVNSLTSFDVYKRIDKRFVHQLIYLNLVSFNGLALIDIALIKRSEVKTIEIYDEESKSYITAYKIDLWRKKTNIKVELLIPSTSSISFSIISSYLSSPKHKSAYLFPIITKDDGNISVCVNSYNGILNKLVKELMNDLGIMNSDEITFYSFRHSFASLYMSNGGSVNDLAYLTGRSATGIDVYIKSLNSCYSANNQKDKLMKLI